MREVKDAALMYCPFYIGILYPAFMLLFLVTLMQNEENLLMCILIFF